MIKNLPANAEDATGSIPGSIDTLEKEIATHSNILVWEIPWTEKPSEIQFMGSKPGQLILPSGNLEGFRSSG